MSRSRKSRWLWAIGLVVASVLAAEVFGPFMTYRTTWLADIDESPAPGHFPLVLFPGEDSTIDRAVWATLEEYEADAINVLSVDGEDKQFPRSAFTAAPPPSGAEQLIAEMNEVLKRESEIRRIDFKLLGRGRGDPEVSVVVIGPRGRHTRSCYEVTKAGDVKPVSLSSWP